jgi:hypothetical protein
MTTRMINGTKRYVAIALLAMLTASGAALADEHGYRAPAHQYFDNRFSHNHFYFDRGYAVRTLPRAGYAIERGRDHFWYDRGVWYRGDGVRWVVVGAPLGAFVPILPPFYTRVWFGGLPYYYANDTYYIWDDGHQEYEVVQPPAGIDAAGTTQPPASDSIFVYAKNGQSSEQMERDRYECHHSAVEQTGYDPTKAGGGVPPQTAATKRADYFRAQAACLDARGYSVK